MDKLQLAERRLLLFRLMSSAGQPSLSQAWAVVKEKFPCTFDSLESDWNRRYSWIPTILKMDDPAVAVQSVEAIRGISKQAFGTYLRCEQVGDHSVAVSALNVAAACHSKILGFYLSGQRRVSFSQTNVTVTEQRVVQNATPKPSDLFQEYQRLLRKQIEEEKSMSKKSDQEPSQPQETKPSDSWEVKP
jgi:hypothetical protein